MAPLLAAHAFGRKVKEAGVSSAIERLLLSANCVSNHEALTRLIGQVKTGWGSWRAFCEAMAGFGEFSPDQWVPSEGLKTSEFAKAVRDRASLAASRVSELLPWAQYAVARSRSLELGLNRFVDALERNGLPPDQIANAFAYRFYASIAKNIFQSSETFSQFSSDRHNAIRQEFAALDKKVVQLRGQHIANSCIGRAVTLPGTNSTRVNEKTEMRLLQHLFPQQQPRVPVRQILERAGRSIQELMPCFMMGPQAVAQFLKPGSMTFDIVVMDEASQLPPAQAIGAIARGKQLVVVGDPKQLPPTSFFSSMATPADGLAVADAESILDICISQFHPTRQLRWHYRSQHHSLIAFSNQKFYDGKLIVFPSPHQKSRSLGVSYHYVEQGIYQDQMNEAEARRVVDAAVEHILTRPDDSLGIVTLNIKQRDLLADMLEDRLRSLPEAQTFREHWAQEGMGLFVKNLETVQGDERDCILISTTFGKAPGTNVVRQHFGPISLPGGWRRLNVLFTRARKAIGVYSSLRPEDIISDANTPVGTRSLRSYLEFARDGVITQQQHTDLPPESDFEVAVIDMLRRKGYEVTPQLGVAGFRIDIAVKHPHATSGYLAAIECDGATYHSGVSVRDRDRIRQEILESLGWKDRIWRIWSTDWFRNPQGEAERLFTFLERLSREPLPGETPPAQAAVRGAAHEGSPALASVESDSSSEGFLFDAEEEDLAITPGDTVAIFRADNPQKELLIKVTDSVSDLGKGLVSMNDDFGAALIGAMIGEHVVVRAAGKAPQTYVVKEIHRS
jgi:transcription elongation GreA/GreB family factor/very-short-patch-repair endonuclease